MAQVAAPLETIDPREIDAALIAGLYRRTTPLVVANIGAIILLTISLWPTADRLHLLTWAVGLGSWTMVRFALARLYMRKARPVAEVHRWTMLFALGSGVAGILWGASILLVTSLEPDNAKLAVAFVMAALSAAAIAGYTNSLTAFTAFLAPALAPYCARLMWFDGSFSPLITAFVLFWAGLMWLMAKHLNHGFREGIALNLQNARLVERLRQARDRAEEASQAKSRFLANMSHEFRTPLNAIIGYAEMIAQKVLGPVGVPQYTQYAEDIRQSGTKLLNVVDQVLDVSRLEAGKVDLSEDTIDVSRTVANALAFFEDDVERDGLEVRVASPETTLQILGDAVKVRQMLLHLISNAVKYTPEGGRILIELSVVSGHPRISVCDTGVGIAQGELERLLIPFARLEGQDHSTRTRALKHEAGQTSTGLALPFVDRVMRLHGGELRLVSTPGVGTTAMLEFPPERLVTNATRWRVAGAA